MKKTHFDLSRKIIAATTSDGWQNVPHFAAVYETEVDLLADVIGEFNSVHPDEHITMNSAILRVIVEGIKAAPVMNSHIEYDPRLVNGTVTQLDHIDISVPMLFGRDRMTAVIYPHMENRSMRDIQKITNGYREKAKKTDLDAVMFIAGLDDTLRELKHGRVIRTAGRLIGAAAGSSRVIVSPKRIMAALKKKDAITPDAIRQGSILVSGVGSLYREWEGFCTICDIIPPQVCALSAGAVTEKPVVRDGEICIRKILPVTICVDHRAMDFSHLVPFVKRIREVLADREALESMI